VLDPEGAKSQWGEWQELLGKAVTRRERVTSNRLELTLSSKCDVGSLVRLAQREVECCPFFRFTLILEVNSLALIVEVSDGAVEILDQLTSEAS
jgi:hypothetical protein